MMSGNLLSKLRLKNYECFALCDLGASVSTNPKSLCDVFGLTDIEGLV